MLKKYHECAPCGAQFHAVSGLTRHVYFPTGETTLKCYRCRVEIRKRISIHTPAKNPSNVAFVVHAFPKMDI